MEADGMVRDGVANMVGRLRECGFDPRRVGPDTWEARCPAHRSTDYALSISRNDFNHAVLVCRSPQNCAHIQITRAVGWSNTQLYEETPDWLIRQLSAVPLYQPPPAAEPAAAGMNSSAQELPAALDACTDLAAPGQAAPACALAAAEPAVASNRLPRPADDGFVESEIGPASDDRDGDRSVDPVAGRDLPSVATGHPAPDGVVQTLLRLAARAGLFRGDDGRFLAQVAVRERFEIYGLESRAFRDWLTDVYQLERREPPSVWAVQRVVRVLEARARFDGALPHVFIRVGKGAGGDDSHNWLDVGDASGTAIRISASGWHPVDRPGIHFRRPEGLLPLPMPERGGSIELLRSYVNLTEPDFRLMVTWLTAALRPVGPYPILVLLGEQGSAKSTLARVLRALIDPQACPLLTLPATTRDLVATAVNGWLLAYDNVGTISARLSDAFCQLGFGLGFASRTLFTNDERSVIYAQRPVILNGIDDFVKRGDMRDRSVFLNLPRISAENRRPEDEFWRAFHADCPRILGALLDGIAAGLRELPSVRLAQSPRMADYAKWGEAFGRGAGWSAGTFLSTYHENRKEAIDELLEDSPLASFLLSFAGKGVHVKSTPLEFYNLLTNLAGNPATDNACWPKSVNTFGTELRRIAPHLALHGCFIDFVRTNGGRAIEFRSEDGSRSTCR
jgi:hypothetical protein